MDNIRALQLLGINNPIHFPMKILSWNVRGAAHPNLKTTLMDMVRRDKPEIIFLLETRLPASRREEIKDLIKYNSSQGIDAHGFSGGIWFLWDSTRVSVDLLPSGGQAFHAMIQVISNPQFKEFSWLLSGVYASPDLETRNLLWDELRTIADNYSGPWVAIGDFNEIISHSEKSGGRAPIPSRLAGYRDIINYCDFLDLGFTGPQFTWTNKRDGRCLIKQRIDRAWANPSWKALFPNSELFHLPRVHSDHCPLLLNLDFFDFTPRNRKFRLEKFWLGHPEFKTLVEHHWGENEDNVLSCSKKLAISLKKWAKRTFGNIFEKKEKISKRLQGIDRIPSSSFTEFHKNLHRSLSEEYQSLLILERDLWFMKSRCTWLVDGDKNTKFYHTSTVKRRSNNRILGLKKPSGVWTHDLKEISNMALYYFENLFDSSHEHSFNDSYKDLTSPTIDTPLLPPHGFIPSREEIFSALKEMAPFKAPGPDGFHPAFYQQNWDIIGPKICDEVQDIFRNSKMNHEWNDTTICLIPKVQSPEFLTQFRPIGLCNVTYKLVTKIIARNIKNFLPTAISPNQTSFVKGRQGSENVIILQELVHHLKHTTNKKGGMLIKLDLDKAYDRLEWSFIRETLVFFKFPNSLIELIMSCVSSSRMAININGDFTVDFLPSRGIRQGDPLSPYLFILCVEFLSLKVFEAQEKGEWKGIRVGRSGPTLSHLFFADDIVFVGQASISNAHTLNCILDFFSERAGEKVNKTKSKVLFSNNTPPDTSSKICDIFGIKPTRSIGNYLGIPITGKRVNRHDCQFIVDKLNSKLSAWKAKFLSHAGRVVLTKSVLNAMINYYSSSILLPASIHKEIDRICRKFLWSSTEENRKMSLVNWDTVCKPTATGGLGFKKAKDANLVAMAKLQWKVLHDDGKPWVEVMRSKYKLNKPESFIKGRGSPMMKSIAKGSDIISKGIQWIPRNGASVLFWNHAWFLDKPLTHILFGPWTETDMSMTINQVWINGRWDFEGLTYIIPEEIKARILAFPISLLGTDSMNDLFVWKNSPSGDFSSASAYLLAIGIPFGDKSFAWIWDLPVLPKIKFFIWIVFLNRILTLNNLHFRGVECSIICPRCKLDVETPLHAFRDCPNLKQVWDCFRIPVMDSLNPDRSISDWVFDNCNSSSKSRIANIPWSCIFPFILWTIWLDRNDLIHNPEIRRYSRGIVSLSKERCFEFWAAVDKPRNRFAFKEVQIGWSPPPSGSCKMNTDGAAKSNPGMAAAGGVLRDSRGRWLGSFARNIGWTTSLEAELWALRDGLQLALNMEINDLILETDSLVAKDLISGMHSHGANRFSNLIFDCRQLMMLFPQCTITHTLREGNSVADDLSKLGLSLDHGIQFFQLPHPFCTLSYNADLYGIKYPRTVRM